jgi:hypothetical protein
MENQMYESEQIDRSKTTQSKQRQRRDERPKGELYRLPRKHDHSIEASLARFFAELIQREPR